MNDQFDKQILWDNSHKLVKLYRKEGKKGPYYMGNLGNLNVVTGRIQQDRFNDNQEFLEISITPVKFTKKGAPSQSSPQQQFTPQEASRELSQPSADQFGATSDEVPF